MPTFILSLSNEEREKRKEKETIRKRDKEGEKGWLEIVLMQLLVFKSFSLFSGMDGKFISTSLLFFWREYFLIEIGGKFDIHSLTQTFGHISNELIGTRKAIWNKKINKYGRSAPISYQYFPLQRNKHSWQSIDQYNSED